MNEFNTYKFTVRCGVLMREEIVYVDAKSEEEARRILKDSKPYYHVLDVEIKR